MSFQIGDRVDFLDEAGGGRITRFLDDGRAMVEADGGFEYPYPLKQLVKREGDESLSYRSDDQFTRRIREKEDMQPRPFQKEKTPKDKLEVDLHIEELHDRPLHLSHGEILHKQLRHCRSRLEWARRERIPRVILIHGVGEGVLRTAIRDLLDREHPDLPYFDAPYHEYGRGATEVRIRDR